MDNAGENRSMKKYFWLAFASVVLVALAVGLYYFVFRSATNKRSANVMTWIRHPQDHQDWAIPAKERCKDAPFQFPTTGFIGYLWDDSFRPGHRHQGLDIFAGTQPGLTPVFSVMDGYLTRQADWKSTVIIRIPQDPLQPDRQIWTYYTHMADADGNSFIVTDFPAGTSELFIPSGTLLGYQGNYSGTADSPTGVHLHFSIVRDDGQGNYTNELDINNTIDPSPYFQIQLNAKKNPAEIPLCLLAE